MLHALSLLWKPIKKNSYTQRNVHISSSRQMLAVACIFKDTFVRKILHVSLTAGENVSISALF